ncbi:uncharacterized protein LOC124935836 [Impatiens glandulifera]|uniref:uncharacterized protein LOC124935836 n=1 Tax=Impatiens glandulifera TaxID=253017 RepID=UPI001FB122BC|nr:uncharacterized protein LOC124935836 [Impatiens glandulifera]
MLPEEWIPPCGNQCTKKYAALTQIPWRIFCKKGCDADGESWEECLSECDEICYKDPVLKDQQWSAFIDRSPGQVAYSEKCFHACVAGCGYKFEIPSEEVSQIHPNRPTEPPPPPKKETASPVVESKQSAKAKLNVNAEDILNSSA